ncbi:MAG: hypothetical protein IT424_15975 [Pirellulales bacterium]|nr:hypothetical protein [Pirellulales bacterium]
MSASRPTTASCAISGTLFAKNRLQIDVATATTQPTLEEDAMAKKKAASKTPKKQSAQRSAKSAKKKVAKAGSGKKKAAKKAAKKSSKQRATSRELIAPRGDRRFVRRDEQGQFQESDDAGRSLAADRRQKAKRSVKSGQGDRGDRR